MQYWADPFYQSAHDIVLLCLDKTRLLPILIPNSERHNQSVTQQYLPQYLHVNMVPSTMKIKNRLS